MRKTGYIIALTAMAVSMQSCLFENDMSYPRVLADITAFSVDGQESSTINTGSRTVDIVLGETVYIDRLEVTARGISDGARCPEFPEVGDIIDLTAPVKYVLSTYQDYEWTVSATQPIERYIRCGNQGSGPIINADNRTALVYVIETQSLQDITITDMKLEREGSEIYLVETDGGTETVAEEPCVFPMEHVDALTGLKFEVRYNDSEGQEVKARWTVAFEREVVPIVITKAIPWCYHIDVEATYGRNGTPYIEYRKADSDEWTRFEDLVVDGINITASIPGDNTADSSAERLEPGTSYELKVCTETSESDVVTVSTCTPDQLYNMGFDDWYSVMSGSYDIWYPNINDSYNVWDTANPGSGKFVGSLTTPTDIVAVPGEGKRAARLESKTAVIAFAAGNIFTGQFGRINGLGAILDWGTPFSGKPCALKGYYAYQPQVIKNAKGEYAGLQNTVDKCQLLVILTDWDTPFTVNTTDGIFVDQTPANPNIIAYGKIEDDKDTFSDPEADDNGYIPFTLELEWWRPEAVPTYAVVIACASYKGDYFIGGEGSLMFVDEFEFVYD